MYAIQLSYANLTANVIMFNSAYEAGGGAHISGGGGVLLTGCEFTRNSAGQGGGLDVTFVSNLTLEFSILVSNNATAGSGSAVRASSSDRRTVEPNVFRSNNAAQGGSAYWEVAAMSEPSGLSLSIAVY